MKGSNRRVWFLVLSAAAAALACDSWTLWDDLFNRTSVQSHPRGWTGGDGAISAALPDGRAVWLFGDSLITSYTSQGQRPEVATEAGHLGSAAWGNTLAIQTNRTSPAATSMTFWGRNSGGSPVTINGDVNTSIGKFFNQSTLGLPASSPDTLLTWPNGAECVNCDGASPRLLVALAKFAGQCDPHLNGGNDPTCIPLCSLDGQSDGQTCHKGVLFSRNVIARYSSINADPGSWARDGATLEFPPTPGVEPTVWGTSFVVNDSDVWIFGRKIHTNNAATGLTSDLMVAKSTLTGILNSSNWQYWNGVSWTYSQTGQVPVASNVGALDSVDKITRGGVTRYLLVHGDYQKMLFARVSDPLSGSNPPTWPATSATTPRLDLSSIDFPLAYHTLDWINRGKCSPDLSGAVPNYSKCGVVYHGLAHAHLATNDSNGEPLFIPVSYVVPQGPNPAFNPSLPEGPDNKRDSVVSTAFYRPRFTAIQLDKLKPWCTTSCWEGIVRDHAARQVGPQSVTYAYDVQNTTRLYVSMTRTAGAANMRVDFFNGLTQVQGGGGCLIFNGVATCNFLRPATAKSAVVTVSGAPTDAYSLRTHYAGFY
jgi:hypothetical protein